MTEIRFTSEDGYRWRWQARAGLDKCYRCGTKTTGFLSRRGFGEACCPRCRVPLAAMTDAKMGGRR